ncbi:hypothetical protein ACGH7X_22470 [Streptomyces sp. BBFR51]|uniref:hypothetical protein n=1 Tax=Streptomyces sp. BBFR51 TaxID=3372856 RepID=UPI0037DDC5FF
MTLSLTGCSEVQQGSLERPSWLVVELPYDGKNLEAIDDELLLQAPRADISVVEPKDLRMAMTLRSRSWTGRVAG